MNGDVFSQSHLSDEDKAAIQKALAYPFEIPKESFLYLDGVKYELASFSPGDIAATVIIKDGHPVRIVDVKDIDVAPHLDRLGSFVPMIASGSNAAFDQLQRKLPADEYQAFVPVVKGRVANACSVYSAHFARRYCSIPATLSFVKGAQSELFCVFVPDHLVDRMHQTEHIGVNYGFYELQNIDFILPGAEIVEKLYAYLSLWGCLQIDGSSIRLPQFSYSGPELPALFEIQILSRVRSILGYTGDLEGFLLSMIRDESVREQRIERLQKEYSIPIDSESFHRLA